MMFTEFGLSPSCVELFSFLRVLGCRDILYDKMIIRTAQPMNETTAYRFIEWTLIYRTPK